MKPAKPTVYVRLRRARTIAIKYVPAGAVLPVDRLVNQQLQVVLLADVRGGQNGRKGRRRHDLDFRVLLVQQTVVQTLVHHDVDLLAVWALAARTRGPPDLQKSPDGRG